MNKYLNGSILIASGLVSACASTPHMEIGYFLPTGSAQFKAIETVACDSGGHVFGAVTATITPSYKADTSRQELVQIKSLDGDFADTSVSFDFYDDGRLKGLNSESTGEGEAVVKAAAAAFSAALAIAEATPKQDCQHIAQWGGEKHVLTLTWVGGTDFVFPKTENSAGMGPQAVTTLLNPDTTSAYYAANLKQIGSVCARVSAPVAIKPRAMPTAGTTDSGIEISLVQPAVSKVEIVKFQGPNCHGPQLQTIESEDVDVPQQGLPMTVRIPQAAVFGKQSVAIALSESGEITKIAYGQSSGAASAITSAGTVLGALTVSDSERLAALKQQADLIAAQERLVACQKAPADCK